MEEEDGKGPEMAMSRFRYVRTVEESQGACSSTHSVEPMRAYSSASQEAKMLSTELVILGV